MQDGINLRSESSSRHHLPSSFNCLSATQFDSPRLQKTTEVKHPRPRRNHFGTQIKQITKRITSSQHSRSASNTTNSSLISGRSRKQNTPSHLASLEHNESPNPLRQPPAASPQSEREQTFTQSEETFETNSSSQEFPTLALPFLRLYAFEAEPQLGYSQIFRPIWIIAEVSCEAYNAASSNMTHNAQSQNIGCLHGLELSLRLTDGTIIPQTIGLRTRNALRPGSNWVIMWYLGSSSNEPPVQKCEQLGGQPALRRPTGLTTKLHSPRPGAQLQNRIWNASSHIGLTDPSYLTFSVSIKCHHNMLPSDLSIVLETNFQPIHLLSLNYLSQVDTSENRYILMADSMIRLLQEGLDAPENPLVHLGLAPSSTQILDLLSYFSKLSNSFLDKKRKVGLRAIHSMYEMLARTWQSQAPTQNSVAPLSASQRAMAPVVQTISRTCLPGSTIQERHNMKEACRSAVDLDRNRELSDPILADVTNKSIKKNSKKKWRIPGLHTKLSSLRRGNRSDWPDPLFSPQRRLAAKQGENIPDFWDDPEPAVPRDKTKKRVDLRAKTLHGGGCTPHNLERQASSLTGLRYDGSTDYPGEGMDPVEASWGYMRQSSGQGREGLSDDDEERLAEANVMGSPWM